MGLSTTFCSRGPDWVGVAVAGGAVGRWTCQTQGLRLRSWEEPPHRASPHLFLGTHLCDVKARLTSLLPVS